jgi:OmcA/MtrC family decaheme c-type cytochrome
MNLCVMCHNPNLSSSGRSIDPASINAGVEAALGPDPLTYPEDAQNFRDMIHGIHSSAFRDRDYEHVRGGRQGYYDWAEVTFPADDGVANCALCHDWDNIELPLSPDLLPTTVRTTGVADGMDATTVDVGNAEDSVPNPTDWINTPTASACFYCHTSASAKSHMEQNGGLLTLPPFVTTDYVNRTEFGTTSEACAVCHGPGRISDLREVHGR